MALQVWLPLNGDLNNQGLNDIIATNNSATVDDNGKIGKCYSFNGVDNYITLSATPSTLFPADGCSYSFSSWVYCTNAPSVQTAIISSNNYRNMGFGLGFRPSRKFVGAIMNSGSSQEYEFSYVMPLNEWHHIVLTFDSSTKKQYLYVDGSFIESTPAIDFTWLRGTLNFWLGRNHQGGWGGWFNGKLNDVRIYDHCLSAKEVSEIAKGLVLHYPLDNGGFGDTVIEEPLYSAMGLNDTAEYDCSGFGNDGTQSGTLVYSTDSVRYSGCCNFTGSNRITTPNIAFENMDAGAMSFWIKFNNEFKNWTHYIFFANGFNWTATGKDFIIVANSGNLSTSVTSTNIALDCCSYNNSFTASLNTWYHIVITWDKNNYTIKKYINGELKATNDDSTNKRLDTYRASHSYHCIGNESSSASYAGDFDVSDFRIYATALSADAIKQLYSSPISVDKSGNLYACEFKEV